jgi:hypothetical protein
LRTWRLCGKNVFSSASSVANSSASPTVAYASGSECSVSASVFFRVIPWLILLSFSVLIKKTSLEGWARLA